jgi:toxin ParE1/3/4
VKAIQYSRAAKADLAKIWRYSAETWGSEQASRYVRELRYASNRIATGQRIGRKSSAQEGMFKIRSGAHMIYYRITPERIDIIRILHGKQDVERHLQP